MENKKLMEVSLMLGDAIKKLDALSAYKPPKTKTLYKWAFMNKITRSWEETDRWMESEDDFKNDYVWAEYKRLDYTAIEVEA